MSIANKANSAFVVFVDCIYELIAANAHYLWTRGVTTFRALKWKIREYKNVISGENCYKLCLEVAGIGDVYAKLICKYWENTNSNFDYKSLARQIVQKKVQDTDIANQKIEENNLKTDSKQKSKKKKVKKPKKKKKKKKKKQVASIEHQLRNRIQVPLSKEQKKRQRIHNKQQKKLKLFLSGNLDEIISNKRDTFCFILLLLYHYYHENKPYLVRAKYCYVLLYKMFKQTVSSNWHISPKDYIFLGKIINDTRTINNKDVLKHIAHLDAENPSYGEQILKYFKVQEMDIDLYGDSSEDSSGDSSGDSSDGSSDEYDSIDGDNKNVSRKRKLSDVDDDEGPPQKKIKINENWYDNTDPDLLSQTFINIARKNGENESHFINRREMGDMTPPTMKSTSNDGKYANIIDDEYIIVRDGLSTNCGSDCDWVECYERFKTNKMKDEMLDYLNLQSLTILIPIMSARLRFWEWIKKQQN